MPTAFSIFAADDARLSCCWSRAVASVCCIPSLAILCISRRTAFISLEDGGVFVAAWTDASAATGAFPDGSDWGCLAGGAAPNAVRGAGTGAAGAGSRWRALRPTSAATFSVGLTENPRCCRPAGGSLAEGDVFVERGIESVAKVLAGDAGAFPCLGAFRARNAAIFSFGFTEKPCGCLPAGSIDPRTDEAVAETGAVTERPDDLAPNDSPAPPRGVFVRTAATE